VSYKGYTEHVHLSESDNRPGDWQWLPTWDENLASVQAFCGGQQQTPVPDRYFGRGAPFSSVQKRLKQFQDDRQRRLQVTT
jgi:hypothetical protein